MSDTAPATLNKRGRIISIWDRSNSAHDMTKVSLSVAGINIVLELASPLLSCLSTSPYAAFHRPHGLEESANLIIHTFPRSTFQRSSPPGSIGIEPKQRYDIRSYTAAKQRHDGDAAILSDDMLVLYRHPEQRMEVYVVENDLMSDQLTHYLTLFLLTRLSGNDGLLLHGSGIVVDHLAAAVIGPSGAGKTTAALMAQREALLSDDVVGVTGIGLAPTLHSTPLGRISDGPLQAPLRALFYPKKAKRFSVQPLDKQAAFQRYLYEHVDYASKGFVEYRKQVYENAARLFDRVPAYELAFALDDFDSAAIRQVLAK